MTSTTDQADSLRQEYEKLSLEASTLAATLARRRADVALMHAEAATVAVSLESAKEQLQDLLRKEKVIRSRVSIQADPNSPRADFQPDQGLIRSLAGQLEVTTTSVKAAEEKKKAIQEEIDALEHKNDPKVEEGTILREDRSSHEGVCLRSQRAHSQILSGQMDIVQEESGAKVSLEQGAISILQEGAQSNSTYRMDRARLNRDVTMPNLALLHDSGDSSEEPHVILGVAIERVFDKVTYFQPTHTSQESPATPHDLRIDSNESMRKPAEHIIKAVINHFGALTVCPREKSSHIRIVAPNVALDRIMDLIQGEESNVPNRPRPLLRVDSGMRILSDGDFISEGSMRSKGSEAPSRRRPHQDIKLPHVPVKLIDPSHVLHKEHFCQIMAQGVPVRFHESALELLYSTNLHGMSLQTLFNRVKTTTPTLLAIRDTKERVFGCYAAAPWKASATRYYGTGESFVFGTVGSDVAKVYKWSRENSFFQFTSSNFLAIGGGAGSHFALWVDEDLLMGTTSACSTFGSPPLTDVAEENGPNSMEFKIVCLEVWGFNAHRKH